MLAQDDASPGDADGDGFLTSFDLDAILEHLLGEGGDGNADANGDGKIDIADWVRLNQLLFPADPSSQLPQISVEVSEPRIQPAGSLTASFTISGVIPTDDLETRIRVQAPGSSVTTGDERTFFSGIVPANGDFYYLDSQGQWSESSVAYSDDVIRETDLQLTLPTDRQGEWAVEVIVQSSESSLPEGLGRQTLIAASDAKIRLGLNRRIANSIDPVRIELETTEGDTDQPIVITALLELPDGSFVSLPGEGSPHPLHTGGSDNNHYLLMNRYLADTGAGMYRVEVKMYAEGGSLLGMANAGFEVCDTTNVVSGTIRSNGGDPLGGGDPVVAAVRAFDVDDAAVTAHTGIASDGSYQLELMPGRYIVQSKVLDAAGWHEALGEDLLSVGCDGTEQNVDLTSSPVTEIPSPLPGQRERRLRRKPRTG